MRKDVIGRMRQRRIGVRYGAFWLILLCVIPYFYTGTRDIIFRNVSEENLDYYSNLYQQAILIVVSFGAAVVFNARGRRCLGITMQLILVGIFLACFQYVLHVLTEERLSFYVGSYKSLIASTYEPRLVSAYEAFFILPLFAMGAILELILIVYEDRRAEMNAAVGGVLLVMGILMPTLLESYSSLRAYCDIMKCEEGSLKWIMSFQMAIAFAASLSVMFVVGVFSPTIRRMIRWRIEFVEAKSVKPLPVTFYNVDVRVSASESIASSGNQNDGSELSLMSLSRSNCASQEATDGEAIPVQSKETWASACGPDATVPKQLMGAAVSCLVAGACFSIANRLFNRR